MQLSLGERINGVCEFIISCWSWGRVQPVTVGEEQPSKPSERLHGFCLSLLPRACHTPTTYGNSAWGSSQCRRSFLALCFSILCVSERERESGSFLLIVVDSLTIAVREVETKERGADTWVHKGHYFVWYSRSTTIYPSAVPLVLSLILELLWSTLIPNDISYDQIYYPVKAI